MPARVARGGAPASPNRGEALAQGVPGAPGANTGPAPQPPANLPVDIVLCDVWSTREQAAWIDKGYQVINVTSRSKDAALQQLSPFYPHGGIPVPENAGVASQSVEGLWQGLKVFEHASIDMSQLTNRSGRGLKRGGPGLGKVLHHWWGPLPTRGVTEPREKLDCTAARQRIYVPAYHFVLEHKVQHIVKQLAQEASRHGLVLLDYGTNADMADPTMPLAHASVLRQYILDNFEALMRA